MRSSGCRRKPHTREYALLRDDLKNTLKVDRDMEDESLDAGGACNFA